MGKDLESSPSTEKTHLVQKKDENKGSWASTIKLILITGSGLFADGWDLSLTPFLLTIMQNLYTKEMSGAKESMLACTTYFGVILGQFSFGFLADVLGRKWTSVTTAIITIASVIACGCVTNNGYFSIVVCLCICRLFAGIGIGGEYPVSAAIAKELGGNLVITRLQLLMVNGLMFTMGCMTQSLFAFIILSAGVSIEVTWRLAILVGLAPTVVAVVLRLFLEEVAAPHPRGKRLSSYYDASVSIFGKSFAVLIVFSGCWMLGSVGSHGILISSPTVSKTLFGAEGEALRLTLQRLTIFRFIMCTCQLAGQFTVCGLIERGASIVKIQWILLILWTIVTWLYCACEKVSWLGAIFYFLTQCGDAAFNITMYLLPSIHFPKAVRATAVGVSAGMGKIGGVIGTGLFPPLEHSIAPVWAIFIAGGFILVTGIIRFLAPNPETQEALRWG